MKQNKSVMSVQTLTLGAVLTALVIVLQVIGTYVTVGVCSLSLVIIPIVIGAAMGGVGMSTWLGFVFSVTVLVTPSLSMAAFYGASIPATIIIVLVKGMLAGFAAGAVYKMMSKWNQYVAIVVAAIVAPVLNTGIFLIGAMIAFRELLASGATGFAALGLIFGLVLPNFLFELISSVALSPMVLRLVRIVKKD